MTAPSVLYCTFTAGELLIGIEVGRVREVLVNQEVIPVPLAAPSIAGLLNLRGEIMVALDARLRLGLPARGPGPQATHVIVEAGAEAISLIVDAEGEVVEVAPDTAQPVPETVRLEIREQLSAMYELDDAGLMLVLDPDRALCPQVN
jgi:purine-binding chemotaxis protein CheW